MLPSQSGNKVSQQLLQETVRSPSLITTNSLAKGCPWRYGPRTRDANIDASTAKVLTKDEARRIARNIAKLPQLLKPK
jgi:hypothetical protein